MNNLDLSGVPDYTSAYVFNCFTNTQVKEINKEINKNIIKKEDPALSAYGRKGDELSVFKTSKAFHVPCAPLIELIFPWLYQCQSINQQVFGYDIYWQFQVEGMNYNIYPEGGEYGWHIDASPNLLSAMKLTCILNLSEEPYEGGDFYMINSNETAKFDSGDGLLLNSLIAHKVTPVTKGKRLTLTYWAMGPSWR